MQVQRVSARQAAPNGTPAAETAPAAARVTLLSQIHTGKSSVPPRLLIYGTEGIGKSTLASRAPNPVFIQTEDGIDQIECSKFPLAQSFSTVMQAISELRSLPHNYQTVVIDSLDWLERLVWDVVCKEYNVDNIEKADRGYQRGYVHATTHWRKLLTALTHLRAERRMMVIMVAHAKVEKFEDPEVSTYDRYSPRVHKHVGALVTEWCDAVLFATRRYRVRKEEQGFGKERAIAVSVGEDVRVLRCVGGPSCVAKNRFNMPNEIPLDWATLAMYLAQGVPSEGQPTISQ